MVVLNLDIFLGKFIKGQDISNLENELKKYLDIKNVNLLFDVQTKSLKFIEDSRKIFPGLLIDYSYLKEKYTVTILKIFEFLWEHNKDLNNFKSLFLVITKIIKL